MLTHCRRGGGGVNCKHKDFFSVEHKKRSSLATSQKKMIASDHQINLESIDLAAFYY